MPNFIISLARYALGLLFLVFGANGLASIHMGGGFIPMPPPNETMQVVMNGLFATGYLMTVVKSIEVVAGLFLISGRFINLALVLLGPVVFNILCIHIFVDQAGLPLGITIAVLWGLVFLGRFRELKVLLRP